MKMIQIVDESFQALHIRTHTRSQYVRLHNLHVPYADTPNLSRNNRASDVRVVHTRYIQIPRVVAESVYIICLNTYAIG